MSSDDDIMQEELVQQMFLDILIWFYMAAQTCANLEWNETKNGRMISSKDWIIHHLDGHHLSTTNFNILCDELTDKILECDRNVILKEQVAMFLQTVGHGHVMRKGALGAIDGAHIKAILDAKDKFRERYCNRKKNNTQNVMTVVDFDGNFVTVVAGWEGLVHDNLILRKAVEEGFVVPSGRYYLVDGGYANTPQFLNRH